MKKINNINNNAKRISDSASSHRYSTGDYSTSKKYDNVVVEPVKPKTKKRGNKRKTVLIGIVILFGILYLIGKQGDGSPSKLSNALKVRKATPFIAEELKKMQTINTTIGKVLGSSYKKDEYNSDYNGGKSVSFDLNYDEADSLRTVNTLSSYEYDDMDNIDETMSIRLEELKVNQGIKLDDRVKGIMLAFSPSMPYDKVSAEMTRIYGNVVEGKSADTTSDFGDVTINISVDYKEEHRNIAFSLSRNIKSSK